MDSGREHMTSTPEDAREPLPLSDDELAQWRDVNPAGVHFRPDLINRFLATIDALKSRLLSPAPVTAQSTTDLQSLALTAKVERWHASYDDDVDSWFVRTWDGRVIAMFTEPEKARALANIAEYVALLSPAIASQATETVTKEELADWLADEHGWNTEESSASAVSYLSQFTIHRRT